MTAFRVFLASQTEITCHEVSQSMSDAMDVAMASKLNMEKVLPLLVAAEQTGMDPVQTARKLAKLSAVLKESRKPS